MKNGSKRLKAIEGTVTFVSYCATNDIPVLLVKKWIDADVSIEKLPPRLQEALIQVEMSSIAELDAKAQFKTLSEERKNELAVIYEKFLDDIIHGPVCALDNSFMKRPLTEQILAITCYGWVAGKQMNRKLPVF
jgi:hypothetical protein